SGQRSGSKIKHRALCKPSFYIIGESLPRALSQHVKLPARRKAPPTFNPNTVLGLIFCWQLVAASKVSATATCRCKHSMVSATQLTAED
ncbi:hypothetical protein CWC14_09420, partial [Pseudoalteromonas sp. S3260]|uniref:hypothetical protein n=1 Tax=Pseudoalteromonas sp. S3260 TaxID=579534 RepID=UPI00126FD7ED